MAGSNSTCRCNTWRYTIAFLLGFAVAMYVTIYDLNIWQKDAFSD